ncbi:MAG: DUF4166 domain-containing protein [Rhodobacteraceae bacterium]|nr:DUF4166 domain-containing protein [Paracoccaceae bacterium]
MVRGRLGLLPLPRPLLPESHATERAEDGRFRFDVELRAPLGLGPIARYRGWLAGSGSGPGLPRFGIGE